MVSAWPLVSALVLALASALASAAGLLAGSTSWPPPVSAGLEEEALPAKSVQILLPWRTRESRQGEQAAAVAVGSIGRPHRR